MFFLKEKEMKFMSVNKVILLGRLGQDPELKYISSGSAVCNFSMATSEGWTDKNGQKQEKTEWHRIVVWGKLGELCNQYLTKGRQAYVEGRIQTRQWEDQNGQKRYTTEVNATTVQFIGSSPTAGRPEQQRPETTSNQNDMPVPDNYSVSTDTNFTADDIPF